MASTANPCDIFPLYHLAAMGKDDVTAHVIRRWVLIAKRYVWDFCLADEECLHRHVSFIRAMFDELPGGASSAVPPPAGSPPAPKALVNFYLSIAEYLMSDVRWDDDAERTKAFQFLEGVISHMKTTGYLDPLRMCCPTDKFKQEFVRMHASGELFFSADDAESDEEHQIVDAAVRLYNAPPNKAIQQSQILSMTDADVADAIIKRWIPITRLVIEKRRKAYYHERMFRDCLYAEIPKFLFSDVNRVYGDRGTANDYADMIARQLLKAMDGRVDSKVAGRVKKVMDAMERGLALVESWNPFQMSKNGAARFMEFYNSGDYAETWLQTMSISESTESLKQMVSSSCSGIGNDYESDDVRANRESHEGELAIIEERRNWTRQYRDVLEENLNDAVLKAMLSWKNDRIIPAWVFSAATLAFLFLSATFPSLLPSIAPGSSWYVAARLLPDVTGMIVLFLAQFYLVKFSIRFRFMKKLYIRKRGDDGKKAWKTDDLGRKVKDVEINKTLFVLYTVGIKRLVRYFLWSLLFILIFLSFPFAVFAAVYPSTPGTKLVETAVTLGLAESVGLGYFSKFFNYKDEKIGRVYWTIIEEGFKLYLVERIDEAYNRRKEFWIAGVSGLDSFYVKFHEGSKDVERATVRAMIKDVDDRLSSVNIGAMQKDGISELKREITEMELAYYAKMRKTRIDEYNKKKGHKSDLEMARLICDYFNFNLSSTFVEKIKNYDEVRKRIEDMIEEFNLDTIEKYIMSFDKDPVSVIKPLNIISRREKTFTILKTLTTVISVAYGIVKFLQFVAPVSLP